MVTSITNYGRSGAQDWLIQRASAIVLLAYTICVGWFLVSHSNLTYAEWSEYMNTRAMRIFSLATVLALVMHAWIGMWGVSTDYFTTRMAGANGNMLRWIFQAGCGVIIFVYLIWTIEILWGVL